MTKKKTKKKPSRVSELERRMSEMDVALARFSRGQDQAWDYFRVHRQQLDSLGLALNKLVARLNSDHGEEYCKRTTENAVLGVRHDLENIKRQLGVVTGRILGNVL